MVFANHMDRRLAQLLRIRKSQLIGVDNNLFHPAHIIKPILIN